MSVQNSLMMYYTHSVQGFGPIVLFSITSLRFVVSTNRDTSAQVFGYLTIFSGADSQFLLLSKGLTQYSFYRSNSFAKSCTSINCTFLLDTSLIICHEVKRELLQKFRVSCYIYPSTRLTLVSHISLFMSWTLIEPPGKSEDEDPDFYVISEESTDEEDNGLRQEYHTDRARLRSRKEFEIV